MRKLVYLVVIFAIGAVSCSKFNRGNRTDVDSGIHKDLSISKSIISKEYSTKSGQVFVLNEDKSIGASISNVKIKTRNFSEANSNFNLGELDPVEKVFLADLDKNGFEEFYVTTRSAGSGSYSKIYGFASNRNKSASPIFISEMVEKDFQKGEPFEGYRGHNQFEIENGVLVNVFPKFNKEDNNSNPTDGESKVTYKLIAGEAGWILKPLNISIQE